MNRLIETTEQTTTDESVIRIEAGRSIKGTYYTKDATSIDFTTELKSAMFGVKATVGLLIASCATLLTF